MAEILVKAVSASNPDPTVDAAGCYKRGDPVVIRDDGWGWGTEEMKPPAAGGRFVIIKITGVTVAELLNALRVKWADVNDVCMPERDGNGNTTRRRKIGFDLDSLPTAIKTQLSQTGTYTVAWTALKGFVRNKTTNTTA